jgi:DNA repair exonuclease SbcCD nuclease subunit
VTELCLIADIHLSDRPPSSCTESYTDDLFNLLQQARELCLERGAPMVWAGDTFHSKAPSRVSHRLVHRVCEFISTCTPHFPVLILAGNHDMAQDRLESVRESQPLGMLYRAGAQELNGWGSPFKVFGVPWLQGYGSYREQGRDLDPGQPLLDIEYRLADALAPYREAKIREPYLVVAHAPLYPPGRELPYEYFPAERWAEAMGGGGNCYYGHIHEPHGVFEAGGVIFANFGALSRGSLHEYNLTRQVGVTFWDDQTGAFEFVSLDAKPASEVFRLQEKQQVTDMQGRLDEFLESAGSARLEILNVESVIAHVRSLGLGKDVEDLVEELLAEAGHG